MCNASEGLTKFVSIWNLFETIDFSGISQFFKVMCVDLSVFTSVKPSQIKIEFFFLLLIDL